MYQIPEVIGAAKRHVQCAHGHTTVEQFSPGDLVVGVPKAWRQCPECFADQAAIANYYQTKHDNKWHKCATLPIRSR